MGVVKKIILHCSDSEFGDAFMIDSWHKARGFRCIGYNDVVLNAFPFSEWQKKNLPQDFYDGSVTPGRAINPDNTLDQDEIGAHAEGYNSTSYGVCMIGKQTFSDKQLNAALNLIRYRLKQFNLTPDDVLGHCEVDNKKTCPNINMAAFREKLKSGTSYGQVIKPAEIKKELSLLSAGFSFLKSFLNKDKT